VNNKEIGEIKRIISSLILGLAFYLSEGW